MPWLPTSVFTLSGNRRLKGLILLWRWTWWKPMTELSGTICMAVCNFGFHPAWIQTDALCHYGPLCCSYQWRAQYPGGPISWHSPRWSYQPVPAFALHWSLKVYQVCCVIRSECTTRCPQQPWWPSYLPPPLCMKWSMECWCSEGYSWFVLLRFWTENQHEQVVHLLWFPLSKDEVMGCLGVQNESLQDTYLAVPTCIGPYPSGSFKFLLDKIWKPISVWSDRPMSRAFKQSRPTRWAAFRSQLLSVKYKEAHCCSVVGHREWSQQNALVQLGVAVNTKVLWWHGFPWSCSVQSSHVGWQGWHLLTDPNSLCASLQGTIPP